MDLSKIAPEFRKEIVRGGDTYLDAQLKIATAADARASNLAGMFTAAATALTAGVVIALFNPAWEGNPVRYALIAGGAVAAIMFLVGAVLCITAIRPVDFWLPGLAPAKWNKDIVAQKKLEDCLGERATNIQNDIAKNSKAIEKNAKLFKWGARCGITAPFIGLLAWAVLTAYRFLYLQ